MADGADVDPLDAYMATLDARPAADAREAAAGSNDWPTARHRSARTGAATTARNRRFQRLQQLLLASERGDDGAYFSDAMMQQRSPALFHFHLGQYLPAAAAAAAAAEGAIPSSATADVELLLSTFLLRASDRREMEARRVWEQRGWGAFVSQDEVHARAREKTLFQRDDVEEEDDSSDDEGVGEDEESKQEDGSSADATSIDVDERRQLLVDLMAQRFLDGSDHEYVDYAAIDGDEALDDIEQMQRDAEDAWFDTMADDDAYT